MIGDITTRDSAKALVDEAVAKAGRIHGLVNCAGVYPRRPILEITDADWDFSFAVNVRGLYNVSVAAIAHMQAQGGGRIVNIASIDALKAHPKNAHYAAMKAAVVSLTKSMGLACAPDNILINGVAPAGIATEKARAAGFLPELAAQTALGRAAEPEDVADVVIFLDLREEQIHGRRDCRHQWRLLHRLTVTASSYKSEYGNAFRHIQPHGPARQPWRCRWRHREYA